MLELKIIKSPDLKGGDGSTFEVETGRSMLLGRSDDCQIRLPSAGISKKHCVITPISASRIEVEDLGSSNGTYINGLLIKKHIMQPGDTLSVHNFVLQLGKRMPDVVEEPEDSLDTFSTDFENESINVESVSKQEGLGDKIFNWLEEAVFPAADKLAEKTDVRLLSFGALAIWTIIVTALSLNPFRTLANERVKSESTEVAKLYARILVKLNQRAVIEQRYKDLIGTMDAFQGQTPGILSTLIMDIQSGEILAPPQRLGQTLPDNARYRGARIALSHNNPYVNFDEDRKTAWVSHPILVANADGQNRVVAAALVEYSYLDGQFTIGNLIDQVVNSLLYALVLSGLFLIYVYRWIDGSLQRTAKDTEKALKEGRGALEVKVEWPSLKNLQQEIGFTLTKALEGGDGSDGFSPGGSNEWAQASALNTTGASASFDENLSITSWNHAMEQVSGVQANMAIGADISEASRDVAFETAVRELAEEAKMMPWSNQSRSIEFSGRDYNISVTFGQDAYLLNIDLQEDA